MTKWPVPKKAFISTVNTTPDICTGDIWQHKMQVRGDFLRPPHGTDKCYKW